MPTPPKPYTILKSEKKSHRSRAELEVRRKGEEALLTGTPMVEWPDTKTDPIAHKQFLKLKRALKTIGKDDVLNEAVINRYCLIISELADLAATRKTIRLRETLIEEWRRTGEMEGEQFYAESDRLLKQKLAIDTALSVKRKMAFDHERENIMTIASGLRSIPKTPADSKDDDPMSTMLNRSMRDV